MKFALVAVAVLLAAPACARSKSQILTDTPAGAAKGSLTVSSTSFKAGGAIAQSYSGYGASVSPQISWSSAAGAKSYALLVEDPDSASPKPTVHWLAWNIPPAVTSLPQGLGQPPPGMIQGTNSKGHPRYDGPHPPPGDPPHHYHFQVFALDRTLTLPSSADREGFAGQAAGHILARGQVIGTYAAPKS
jgi:Raf kinase inhibitor-like YbhB/YbcL family protein